MNKQDFINILKQPLNITDADLKKLEELAGTFPYCQAAHILIAKGNYDYGSMLAEQKIKKAALYASDRKNLRSFIHVKPALPTSDSRLTLSTPASIRNEIATKEIRNEKADPSDNSLKSNPESKITMPPAPVTSETKDLKSNEEIPSVTENQEVKSNRTTSIIDNFLSSYSSNEEIAPEKKITQDIHKSLADLKKNREKFLREDKKSENRSDEGEEEKKLTEKSSKPTGLNAIISPSEIVQESKLISESELLLGYLEFLKSDRTLFKRDPEKINQIIDKFIKEDPTISPVKPDQVKDNQQDLTEPIVQKRKSPVSETFAVILEKQGKIEKSIEIYEELILKYPEKKAYFAGRIEDLKNQLNK